MKLHTSLRSHYLCLVYDVYEARYCAYEADVLNLQGQL